MGLGGDVVVTGLGASEEDEFFFTLLKDQAIWDRIVLGRPEETSKVQKRFLSRTARYSGLLNTLEFKDIAQKDSGLDTLLKTANTWMAFNLTATEIPAMQKVALKSDIERVIFTMQLPAAEINDTAVPALDAARVALTKAGKTFTGIRHGAIVSGDEDNAYEIVNSTVPCMEPTVERGVLARIAAELLSVDEAADDVCGVSSSGAFAAAYLNVLRSSGLTRNQEVMKMYTGGMQRVARLTVSEYEAQAQAQEEARIKKEKRLQEKEEEEARDREAATKQLMAENTKTGSSMGLAASDPGASITPLWDEEEEETGPTVEEKLEKRTNEILQNVWVEYDARMYAKSTSKLEFFGKNRERALALAKQEFEDEAARRRAAISAKRAKQSMLAKMVDVNRKQYSKLLALERKEMANQKVISDTWVKYIYLLIETTLRSCEAEGILFNNMDEFAQTMQLRKHANNMRAECGIDAYDVIYDPLDASIIVEKLCNSKIGKELGLNGDAEELVSELDKKYGDMLMNVSALRGANQIIELAIKTIKSELPPAPPSVDELRRTESSSMQALVSSMRLEAIKKRGQPAENSEDAVGRL